MKHRTNITSYLKICSKDVKQNKVKFVHRAQHQMDIPIPLAKAVIEKLTPDNWYEGPVPDDGQNRNGYVCMFKYKLSYERLYIKLKLIHNDNNTYVLVLSCHNDDI